jgi:hypothetical protein
MDRSGYGNGSIRNKRNIQKTELFHVRCLHGSAFSDKILKINVFNILSFFSPVDTYILLVTKFANG